MVTVISRSKFLICFFRKIHGFLMVICIQHNLLRLVPFHRLINGIPKTVRPDTMFIIKKLLAL